MRKAILAGLFALGVLGVACVQPAQSVERAAIDRAIERGVGFLRTLQRPDGTWSFPQQVMGATALAGLTLLECGAEANDKSVAAAADHVRTASISCTQTYSLALGILFLDRLGDPGDVPLIESMTVKLLAGQIPNGGWDYTCPAISAEEGRRLTTAVRDRNELTTRREPPRPGARRTVNDLPPEIKAQLAQLGRPNPGGGVGFVVIGDNSNTQFATIALWVARRHGLPVDDALGRIALRFRSTQNPDGGWGYSPPLTPPGGGPAPVMMPGPHSSTATMTCAGVLGLTVVHGAIADRLRERDPKARTPDLEKDAALARALAALSTAIDHPAGDRKDAEIPRAAGKSYYFLWSLERVCVALDLDVLDKKDWYAWGAEILLANQQSDGSWRGEFADCGADTCFALLFLKRSNLARDLTANIRGKLKDPAEAVLKAGGVGGAGLKKGPARLKPAIEGKNDKTEPERVKSEPERTRPDVPRPDSPPLPRLAEELVKAPAAEQAGIVQKLQETRGVENTEALAFAIPRLEGEIQQKARDALAARLTRLKPESLTKYLEDDDAEIRRAAALACAAKKVKEAVPKLIARLRDRDPGVARAAHAALKELSGKDLGPTPAEWEAWWQTRDR